jgi:exonuclease VII small subunit
MQSWIANYEDYDDAEVRIIIETLGTVVGGLQGRIEFLEYSNDELWEDIGLLAEQQKTLARQNKTLAQLMLDLNNINIKVANRKYVSADELTAFKTKLNALASEFETPVTFSVEPTPYTTTIEELEETVNDMQVQITALEAEVADYSFIYDEFGDYISKDDCNANLIAKYDLPFPYGYPNKGISLDVDIYEPEYVMAQLIKFALEYVQYDFYYSVDIPLRVSFRTSNGSLNSSIQIPFNTAKEIDLTYQDILDEKFDIELNLDPYEDNLYAWDLNKIESYLSA